jgi:serine/threonine protein kinase
MSELPMIGTAFAGYQLRAVIGRGGMSVVYQAENPRLGSAIALKVLPPELATDEVFRARFLNESRIAASLHHPNVIPVYDMGSQEDLLYIAMRFVSGTDLRQIVRKRGQVCPDRALSLVGQAARALDAAHREGLVHRDVKPGNLLIERGGDDDDPDHLYLADFGISKHAMSRSGLTLTGQFLGTIDYVAPEQIVGGAVTGLADQYSLGCVLYECLTGQVPFRKDLDAAIIWAHVEESPAMPSTVCAELPPGLDDVFARVLAKRPADRYASCREFVDAARVALAGVPAGSAVRPPRPDRSGDQVHVSTCTLRADGDRPDQDGPGRKTSSAQGRQVSPRRRLARPRWLAALAALILIATGTSAWALAGGPAAHPHRGMPMPSSGPSPKAASPKPMASPMPSPAALLAALRQTNSSPDAAGKLPPATCRGHAGPVVTCTAPAAGITQAVFQTYPSLTALYAAYVAEVKMLNAGQFKANTGDCQTHDPAGEVSWNHGYDHTRNYSVAQLISGHLNPVTQAAGRVFCNYVNGQEYMVWTQDDGRLLASAYGPVHGVVWEWWYPIHHNIGFAAAPMKM